MVNRACALTVKGSIHPADVDQQTDHSHALCSLTITKQFVAQNLAGLATSGHGVDVEVGKSLLLLDVDIVAVGEDLLVVVKDGPQEIVLYVLSPKWLAIVLFEMSNLANGLECTPGAGGGTSLRATRSLLLR